MPTIFDSTLRETVPSARRGGIEEIKTSSILEPTKEILPNAKSKQKNNLLASYCESPSIKFESQSEKEAVVLLVRAHFISQLPWIFVSVILCISPLFLSFFIARFLSIIQLIFAIFLWYLAALTYGFTNLFTWIYNLEILTNYRVIDVDYHGVLYKEVNTCALSKIEDVAVRPGGFIPSIFHFGNLYIETAGVHPSIEFSNIPSPDKVAGIIHELIRSYGK